MRRAVCMLAAVLLILSACEAAPDPSTDSVPPIDQVRESSPVPTEPDAPEDTAPMGSEFEMALTLTIGGNEFTVTLADNGSARQLVGLLPLTLDMSELNGNEKFFYLDTELPADPYQPGQINAGDLMLYGDNCLVLFYENFTSGYSYTRLGGVDTPAGLAEALGNGGVEVTFTLGGEK